MLAALLFLIPSQEPTLESIVAKLNQSLKAAKTLSLTAEVATKDSTQTYQVKAMRPNLYRVEGADSAFYSDGQASWLYYQKLNRYLPFGDIKGGMHVPLATGFSMFSPPPSYKDDYLRIEKAEFQSRPVHALVSEPKQIANMVVKLFVDPQTYLPVGAEQRIGSNVQTTTYRDVKTTAEMSPIDFIWTPPAGAAQEGRTTVRSYDLLKPGVQAPEFKVPATDGKQRTLNQLLKGKKALLVNFWFINCGYCLVEMPLLDKLYAKLRDKGLEMFVVNDIDSSEEVQGFLKKTNYRFPVGIDADKVMAKAYKVAEKGHPITYLITADGKVAHVEIGFNPKEGLKSIEAALQRLGVR